MEGKGLVFTVRLVLALPVQPFPSVTVTEYVPEAEGLMHCAVPPVLHE